MAVAAALLFPTIVDVAEDSTSCTCCIVRIHRTARPCFVRSSSIVVLQDSLRRSTHRHGSTLRARHALQERLQVESSHLSLAHGRVSNVGKTRRWRHVVMRQIATWEMPKTTRRRIRLDRNLGAKAIDTMHPFIAISGGSRSDRRPPGGCSHRYLPRRLIEIGCRSSRSYRSEARREGRSGHGFGDDTSVMRCWTVVNAKDRCKRPTTPEQNDGGRFSCWWWPLRPNPVIVGTPRTMPCAQRVPQTNPKMLPSTTFGFFGSFSNTSAMCCDGTSAFRSSLVEDTSGS